MIEIPSRWRKILNDMWSNKSRTLLVVLSISIGVATVGMISNAWLMIERDLYGPMQEINAHSVSLYVSPFQEDLVSAVEDMREVEMAEARRIASGSVYAPDGLETIALDVVQDFADVRIDQFTLEEGTAVPGVREMLLERRTAKQLEVAVGDPVIIELDDGQQHELIVVGIVHDLTKVPPELFDELFGYVSMDTLVWMGQYPYYNRLDIVTAQDPSDKEHVLGIAGVVRDRVIEPNGYRVASITFGGFSSNPRDFWAQDQIDGISIIFNAMSVLCILLSAGLVVNTISAILTQQVKQIGIMRSIGATRRQIIQLYFVNVLIFSAIALVIAIPLGLVGAIGLATFITNFLNFDITRYNLPTNILLMQIAIGFFVPMAAALVPILAGTNISVYDAVYQHGLSGSGRSGPIDNLLNKLRTLTRPLALAFRNTFRNKARLTFTLITLTLAGAMFISVFSTRASLESQLNEAARYSTFDAIIGVSYGTSIHTAEREALQVPGVTVAEGWATATAFVVRPDGTDGQELRLFATLSESPETIDYRMIEGRWLVPSDTRHTVINEDLLVNEPWIEVGNTITLNIGGQTREYEVVGLHSRQVASPAAYITYGQFTKSSGQSDPVSEVRVLALAGGIAKPKDQDQMADLLEQRFEDIGLSTSSARTRHGVLGQISNAFDIILIFLVIMATLLAIVGGLGLAGTMSMNVMDRTREIGVLRAVGASNWSIQQIVLIEGMVVGLTSWVLGVILSVPLGKALSDAVGLAVLQTTLPFEYSFMGMLVWLGLALIIGAVASMAPARRASNLTVREVLSYE